MPELYGAVTTEVTCNLVLEETCHIQPGVEKVVRVKVDDQDEEELGVTQWVNTCPLPIGQALVKAQDGRVWVTILNPHHEAQVIPAGVIIGQLEPILAVAGSEDQPTRKITSLVEREPSEGLCMGNYANNPGRALPTVIHNLRGKKKTIQKDV